MEREFLEERQFTKLLAGKTYKIFFEGKDCVIADKNTPVFVYCLRGSRSASAVSAMEKMGYTNAKSIGGIVSYKGKTVIRSN